MSANEIILEKLQGKKWYLNTKVDIREELVNNSESGLLKRLETIGDVNEFGEIQKVIKVVTGDQVKILTFEIRASANNELITSEVVMWKNGENFLSRGVILIEKEGKPTHLLVEKKFNLVNFKPELQTFGMVYPDFVDGKIVKLPQKLEKALPNHTVKMYYDLGYVNPENSLLMGKTFIFALSIDLSDIEEINNSKVHLLNLENKDDWDEISDSYFLAIYSRLILKKIL